MKLLDPTSIYLKSKILDKVIESFSNLNNATVNTCTLGYVIIFCTLSSPIVSPFCPLGPGRPYNISNIFYP